MSEARENLALPTGREVGRYRLQSVARTWGFYLTYLAEETATGQPVTVHELLPEELIGSRDEEGKLIAKDAASGENLLWARDKFFAEGRALAAFSHPTVAKVIEVVEAHGTAYWVMPREQARTLKTWLAELGRPLTERELFNLVNPLLDGLEKLHAAGVLHLNLKPETIQLTATGKPVLYHFAGARQAIAEHCHSASAITPGYSAPEQYDPRKAEGSWTDIYGLAAVLHRAIAGQPPADVAEKLSRKYSSRYGARLLAGIDAALHPDPNARPQTIAAWRRMLGITPWKKALTEATRRPLMTAATAVVVIAILLALLWPKPPRPDDDKQTDQDKSAEKSEDEKKQAETDQQQQAENDKKAEEEKRKADEKMSDEKKLAEEEAAQKKAEEEAKRRAEEKLAAEMEAKKAGEQKRAQPMTDPEMAAKKLAEQQAEAERQAREMAARKQAEEQAARKAAELARKAEEERRAAEKAARDRLQAEQQAKKLAEEKARRAATPPPGPPEPTPVPQGPSFYISGPIIGSWISPDGASRLEIKGSGNFTLSGTQTVTGQMSAYNGKISFWPTNTKGIVEATFTLRALDRVVIEGPLAAGEWQRVKTPPPAPSN